MGHARGVVRSMVELCHDMGKAIIAEGVETPEENHVLHELGCDYLQGYLLAKPGRAYPSVSPCPLVLAR